MGVLNKLLVVFAVLAVANMISLKVNHQSLQEGLYTIHPFNQQDIAITATHSGLQLALNKNNTNDQKFHIIPSGTNIFKIKSMLNHRFIAKNLTPNLGFSDGSYASAELFELTHENNGYLIKTHLSSHSYGFQPELYLSPGGLMFEQRDHQRDQIWAFKPTNQQ